MVRINYRKSVDRYYVFIPRILHPVLKKNGMKKVIVTIFEKKPKKLILAYTGVLVDNQSRDVIDKLVYFPKRERDIVKKYYKKIITMTLQKV